MLDKHKIRGAVVATVVVAALGVAGVATAEDTPRHPGAPSADGATSAAGATPTLTTDHGAPQVEHQAGIVLEGSGSAGGLTASVSVYENSVHGNSVQVVLTGHRVGYQESATAYVVDGSLHATVEVAGEEAVLSGTLEPVGKPEKSTEPFQDGGEQVVTQGTHTQLAGDVTLTYDGVAVPLDLAPAFAYDLLVRKVDLYGS